MSMLSSRCSVLTAALIGSTLALGSTLISKPAFAGTATSNLQVSATIPSSCTIAASPLAFGNYDGSGNVDSTATLTVSCSSGTTAIIGLDQGLNPSGSSANSNPLRRLKSATSNDYLDYKLSDQSSFTTVWPNAVSSSQPGAISYTGTGGSQSLTVYGRISAAQGGSPGSYSDTVVATITY